MKKVLKKGFTLIELMVVIAIIGILATTLAPKLREQLARAKDSKAVSLLGATRTIASSLIISQMTGSDKSGEEKVHISWESLMPQLDVITKGLITPENKVIIGGSRETSTGKITYGDSVVVYTAIPVPTGTTGYSQVLGGNSDWKTLIAIKDASDLHLLKYKKTSDTSKSALENSNYSTEGKQWTAY